jgi:RNA-directed DNA polymerase
MSAVATPAGAVPRDPPHWHSINWKTVGTTVRRLQARIVKAVQARRWGKVKALVYLLTHSFSGRAMAILRVTTNDGAKTPGVDGETWNDPESKSEAFHALRSHGYQPMPLRRVHIPKNNGKKRPLGIPTLTDRAHQALHLLGFDPIHETVADPNSYGFRPERCCADALAQCHILLRQNNGATWILEGDIRACFDRIDHEWLLAHVPMDTAILRSWLKAGYLENRVWHPTAEGTPQGGIISPVLANWALNGLEERLAKRFAATRGPRRKNKVHLVRYADDFIITGTSKALLQNEVRPLVEHFLQERGLELSHEKTKLTHIDDGFDFLGQTVRRYGNGKTLLKPSRKNVKTFRGKIREFFQTHGGSMSAGDLIARLNPLIRGWAMYHRHASSKRTFAQVDRWVFQMIWRWLRCRHGRKSARWRYAKYFRQSGPRLRVFSGVCYTSKGKPYPVHLTRAADVPIRYQIKIRANANPYDPWWECQLEERRHRQAVDSLTGRRRLEILWTDQKGKCPECEQPLKTSEEWNIHHVHWRVHGGHDLLANLVLLHGNCHRRLHSQANVVGPTASREGRSQRLEPDEG